MNQGDRTIAHNEAGPQLDFAPPIAVNAATTLDSGDAAPEGKDDSGDAMQ